MGERTRFTAYITKYALTAGIEEILVEDCFHISPQMVTRADKPWFGSYFKDEWHRTRNAAVERAEAMRLKKIKSLEAQIKRLNALSFANKDGDAS